MHKSWLLGAAAAGTTLLGAAVVYYLRENSTEQPDYRVLASDENFEIRQYVPIVVAETEVAGERKQALSDGFRILADYIFAKSRGGEKLPMTAPVMQDAREELPMAAPVMQDGAAGRWRVRFVMPGGRSVESLPPPPARVRLIEVSGRRVAAARFSGVADDDRLIEQQEKLESWLEKRGETVAGEAEFAFYNSPMIPPLLRRSEVLLPLD